MGTQSRLNFLPEKQTDFIIAIIGEEFGFLGMMLLLGMFAAVIWNGVQIALAARSHFGRLLAMGVTLNFFLYIMINGLMVMGLIPVVGNSDAAGLLWRHRDDDGDDRVRPADVRARPPPGHRSEPLQRHDLSAGSWPRLARGRLALGGQCRTPFAKTRLPRVPHRADKSGRIAQVVEQLTLNQRVAGSSPAAPTPKALKSLNNHDTQLVVRNSLLAHVSSLLPPPHHVAPRV